MTARRDIPTFAAAATLCAASLVSAAGAQASGYEREIGYSVTVTNITKGIRFTPVVAASHTRAIALFELGQPASAPLADVAESGSIDALRGVLEDSEAVAGVAASEGLLEPGASTTFTITTTRRARGFSLAAMLLPTNDSFVALDSVRLPYYRSVSYRAAAYDAGSEPNDEICANIPGPTCGGEGRSPDDSNAEGFVHVANGIHGRAGDSTASSDLDPAVYDWRGAVAEVTITRIR